LGVVELVFYNFAGGFEWEELSFREVVIKKI
jgi:hypothetical protein